MWRGQEGGVINLYYFGGGTLLLIVSVLQRNETAALVAVLLNLVCLSIVHSVSSIELPLTSETQQKQ